MKTFYVITLLMIFSAVSFSQDKVFTESDSQISVTAGETFIIKLVSNKSTGYSWSIMITDSNPDGVIRVDGDIYESPEPGKMGASGNELWYFTPMKTGFSNIIFQYSRPWEKDTAPAKTLTFGVNIQ